MKTVLVDIDTQRQRCFLECGDPATAGPLSKPRTCPRTPRRVRIKDRRTLAISFVISLALPFGAFAQENPAVAPRALPVAAGPNDVARFLAGMPVPENSPLAPLTRDPAWQQHAAFFEEQFT
jgi:hypothetical protein